MGQSTSDVDSEPLIPEYAPEPAKLAAKKELLILAVTVPEDAFFSSRSVAGVERLRRLVGEVTRDDLPWVFACVRWLRTQAHERQELQRRTLAIVIALEATKVLLKLGVPGGRELLRSALRHVADPATALDYWVIRYGQRIPKPVKRGIADAVRDLYTESALVKWGTSAFGVRFGDVIKLTHPKPGGNDQAEVFRYIVECRNNPVAAPPESLRLVKAHQELWSVPVAEREKLLVEDPSRVLKAGFTWENIPGWLQVPMTAAAWEAIIGSMSYTGLLHHLQDFDEADISDAVDVYVKSFLSDPDRVERSRPLPLQFLSVYCSTGSGGWDQALELALQFSIRQVPRLPGRTLVLVDRSDSMFTPATSVNDLTQASAAVMFGVVLAKQCDEVDLIEFGSTSGPVMAHKDDLALRMISLFNQLGPRDTANAVRNHFYGQDRVVIVTDAPVAAAVLSPIPSRVPVYMWNLSADPSYVRDGSSRHVFGGLTDMSFFMIDLLEKGQEGESFFASPSPVVEDQPRCEEHVPSHPVSMVSPEVVSSPDSAARIVLMMRERLGYSRDDLATWLGVDVSMIESIEFGRVHLDLPPHLP